MEGVEVVERMNTRYMGEDGRARWITEQFGNELFASPRDDRIIVDLGCRDSRLSQIQTNQHILGVDREDGENVDVWCDLDEMRSWSKLSDEYDAEYVTVVASHILEHLADVHRALSHVAWLANEYILIGLPNELNFIRRFHLIRGKLHSKWNVTGRNRDYHHWFFTIESARALCRSIFEHKGFKLVQEETPYFELDPERTKWSTRIIQTIVEWVGSDNLRCRDWWGLFRHTDLGRYQGERE